MNKSASKLYQDYLRRLDRRGLIREPSIGEVPLPFFFATVNQLANDGIRGTFIRRFQQKRPAA